jgi:DoxX-like protein
VFIAYTVVAVVFGLATANSAVAKLRRNERVVGGLAAAGVPASWFVPLALLNLAGAIGLWIGIAWRPLGIAAATGLVLYFAGALIAHLRTRDLKGMPVPAALLVIAALALTFGILSA